MLNHTPRGDFGKVLKSSKGNFDDEMPVQSLLDDTLHVAKVAVNNLFVVVNYVKSQQCGCMIQIPSNPRWIGGTIGVVPDVVIWTVNWLH